MKLGFMNILLIVACIITSFGAVQAHAQINIAVVDIEGILAKSKAAISIKEQVKTKRNDFLAEVKSEEDKLRADQQAIEKQRSSLSKEELLKKLEYFEKRRLKASKKIKERKSKLDGAYTQAMNKMTKSIFEVCQEIANEENIDLVITRQNIIVGSMSLDITNKVMDRLNKKIPNLKLKVK